MQLLVLLQQFFLSRFGSSLLGLIAILSLFWSAGSYIGLAGPVQRLAVMTGILLCCVFGIFLRWWWVQIRGKQLHEKLQTQNENSAGRQLEIELLKEKMALAIATLKSSELGVKYRGNAALYALPWFMVIGPSAAGKSTLLKNSGLHFPFTNREDLQVKGFGGTRNCDWWFANEAVILDTAGRYTTEDEDQEEWIEFLHLLKKYYR